MAKPEMRPEVVALWATADMNDLDRFTRPRHRLQHYGGRLFTDAEMRLAASATKAEREAGIMQGTCGPAADQPGTPRPRLSVVKPAGDGESQG